jgi:ribosome-associated toxin RatA of RatAB toxin-antitoxin module
MPSVQKSVHVAHAAATMFNLVDAFERYPEFLPWCSGAEVFERTAHLTRGRLDIDFRGWRSHITTANHKRRPHEIRLELVDGPFESFSGLWTFTALGDAGCKVTLALDYTLASGALQAVTGPVFAFIAGTLVERFVERADALAQ